jgi:large subunit ribosomal protein L25
MTDFVVNAEPRNGSGTADSRRLRHSSKIPAVIYGAGKENANVVLEHNPFLHQLEVEAFHTSILSISDGGKNQDVILREVQMHPYKPLIMHVDFQRVKSSEKIHMNVPLHFVGDDIAPGIKVGGGMLSHLINEVDISCLPKDLPDFLEVDVSGLELHASIHLSELVVPKGVEITLLSHDGGDQAVASILPPQKNTVEEDAEDQETAADSDAE